jgi:autotransporter-associated beta strand protein
MGISSSPLRGDLQWDPGFTPGSPSGGSGAWDDGTIGSPVANWSDGTTDVVWPNNTGAIFGGTGGVVTLNPGTAGISATNLTFNASNYWLTGVQGVPTITLTGTPSITVTNANDVASSLASIGGTANLTKAGAGSFYLQGALNNGAGTLSVTGGRLSLLSTVSTFTGNVSIDGATSILEIQGSNGNATSGPLGIFTGGTAYKTVTLSNGGTFRVNSSFNDNVVTAGGPGNGQVYMIGTGGGTFDVVNGATFTLDDGAGAGTGTGNAQLQGSGNLTKIGSGTLSLGNGSSNFNTFTGNLFINAGTVQLGSGTNDLGDTVGGTTVSGSGAALSLNGNAVGAEPLTIAGTGINSAGAVFNNSGTAVTSTGTVTLTADASLGGSGTTTYTGVVSGGFQLTKVGTGTIILGNTETHSGGTRVNAGTLRLDFSQGTSPASDILVNGSTLTLAGGTLNVTGKASTVNSQTFGGLTLLTGASGLSGTIGTGGTVNVTLGAITRNNAATVDFTLPATGVISTTSGTDGAVLVDSNGTAFSTVAGADWAAKDTVVSGKIIALPAGSYTASTTTTLSGNATVATGVNTTLSADTTIGTLRFNLNEARTITVGAGKTLSSGGILVTSTPAANVSTITGGNLTGPAVGGTNGDLAIFVNTTSAQPGLTLASAIVNNPAGTGGTGITKAGAGILTLSNASNSFTGGLNINQGSVIVSNAGALGAGLVSVNAGGSISLNYTGGAAGNTVTLSGGTLTQLFDGDGSANVQTIAGPTTPISVAADSAITVGRIATAPANKTLQMGALTLGSNILTINNNNGYGLDLQGTTTLSGTPTISVATASFSNTITGLTLSGQVTGTAGFTKTGAGTVALNNAGNNFTGDINITQGTVAISSATAIPATTTVNLNGGANVATLRATSTFSLNRTILLSSETVNANAIEVSAGNTLTLSSPFAFATPTATISKNDAGTLILAAAQDPNWVGATIVNQGILQLSNLSGAGKGQIMIGSGSIMAQGAVQILAGQTVANPLVMNGQGQVQGINFGGGLEAVSGTSTWSGPISQVSGAGGVIGADAGATLNLTGGLTNANTSYWTGAGTINLSGGPMANTGAMVKLGTGTFNLTVVDTPNLAAITVQNGTMSVSGAGKFGTATGVAVTINPGGTLNVDDSGTATANRLGTRTFTTSGTFNYTVNSGAASSESLTAMTWQAGRSSFNVINLGGQASTIAVTGALTQSAGSSINFTGALGTATNKITIGTAPTLVPATTGILARATVGGADFATYGTNGIAAFSGYVSNLNTAAATDTLKLTAGSTLTSSAKTINALAISGSGITVNANTLQSTLTLTSGGLLVTGGTNTINIPIVALGGTEGVFHVDSGATANMSGAFTGTAGLQKTDPGTLNFTRTQFYTGTTYVNSGTLQLASGGANTIFANGAMVLNSGGTLDLNGGVQYVGSLSSTSAATGQGQLGGVITTSTGSGTFATNTSGASVFAGTTSGNVTFVRSGTAVATYTNALGHTGPTLINGGGLSNGNTLNGTTLSDLGSLLNTSAITINYASLNLNNSTSNNASSMFDISRLSASTPISMSGGGLGYYGRGGAFSTQSVGAITLAQGLNIISSTDQSNNAGNPDSATLNVTSLSRPTGSGSTVIFAQNYQNNSSGSLGLIHDGAGRSENIVIGSINGTSTSTVGAALTNNILGPWALVHNGYFNNSNTVEFASYTPQFGVGALNSTGFAGYSGTAMPTSNQPNQNIRVAGTAATLNANVLSGGQSLYTLNMVINVNNATSQTGGTTLSFVGANDTLTLSGGGLITSIVQNNGGNAIANTMVGAIGTTALPGKLTSGYASGAGYNDLYLYYYNSTTANALTINSAIVDNGATPVRFIAGGGNFGAAAVTLAGNNAYTGGTIVNTQNVTIASGSSLPASAGAAAANGLTINNGTVTQLAGATIGAQPVTLNGGSTLTLAGTNTLTSVTINNSGGTSAPTVALGSGTLNLTGSTPIAATSSNVATTATISGGTIDIGSGAKTFDVGAISFNGANLAPIQSALTISATIQGAASVTKSSGGMLQLSGANTFSGGMNVTGGGLIIGVSSTPTGNGTIVSGPVGTGTLTMAAGTTLESTGAFTVLNPLVIQGNLNFAGANNLTFNGPITLPGGPITIDVAAPTMTASLLGNISGTTSNITKTGLGNLVLSSGNGAGSINFPSGGPYSMLTDGDGSGNPENLGFPGITSGGAMTITIGRLATTYAPYYITASNKKIQISSLDMGGNALTLTNNNGYGIEVTGGTSALSVDPQVYTISTASASNVTQGLTISGQLTGPGGIQKLGAGTLVLNSATNTFGGSGKTINIQAGVVAASSDGALGDPANVINLNVPNTFSAFTTTTTNASTALTAIASTANLSVGQQVYGVNVPTNTTLSAIPSGTTGTLSQNATGTATNVLTYVSANVGFRATGTFATSHVFNFGQSGGNNIDVTGGNVFTLNSAFTGTSGTTTLVKEDTGTLVLAAANPTTWTGSYTLGQGLTGGVAVIGGVVQIANAQALGNSANPIVVYNNTGALVQIAGGVNVPNPLTLNHLATNAYAGGVNWSGTLQSVGNVTNTWSGAIQLNQDAGIGADSGSTLNVTGGVNQNGHILVLGGAGNINVTTNGLTNVFALDKIGSGLANINAPVAAPSTSGIRVFAGELKFSGSAGAVATGTVAAIINPGGTLTLDNGTNLVANRLGGRPITYQGGTFNLIGNSATTGEAIGAPTFARGQTTINIDASAGGGTNLTFTAAANNVAPAQSSSPSGATALFHGTSMGSAAAGGVATLADTTTGFTFNGQTGAAGTTSKGILPWALVGTSLSDLGSSFATADTATAIIRPLAAGEYASGTISANNNMLVTTGLTAQPAVAPNSLTFDTGGSLAIGSTNGIGNTVTLSSGGILVRNGVSSAISGGVLSAPAGNSPFSIHTPGTAALTISSILNGGSQADRVGFVKAGAGTLTLSTPTVNLPGQTLFNGILSNNMLNMQTVVNQGTLKLNGGLNTLGANNFVEVSPGGTLDLNATHQYVLGLFTDGSFNGVANTVTAGGSIINSGATQSTLVTNSDGRNWAGQISGNIFYNRAGTSSTTTMYTPQSYTGGTLVNGGTLSLRDYGALTQTSAIDISYAALTLDNTQGAFIPDRIRDGAAITMRGATMTFNGRQQTASTETIGAVSVVEGFNFISNNNQGVAINSTELTVTSLSRPTSATGTIRFNGANGQIGSASRTIIGTINGQSTATVGGGLTNNIIGPWAVQDREWASHIPTLGIGQLTATGFAGYATSTLAGTPLSTDNIRVTATPTAMNAGKTIYTLNNVFGGNTTVDLGGFALTLAGGGLGINPNADNITGTVQNGTITSTYANGIGSGTDLYLYHLAYGGTNRQGVLSAGIVDSSGSSPLRLVITDSETASSTITPAGVGRLTLSGNNTYTGGTVINGGNVVIGVGGVLPATGGVTLNGASLIQMIGGQASRGTINPATAVTLNGNAQVNLVDNNTLAGLSFNNEGGTAAPTVNSFSPGLGTGSGTLTLTGGITAVSSNVGTTSVINGRVDFGSTAKTINVDPIMVNGVSINPLQPGLALQGVLNSSGGITKTGNGVLQFNSQAIFTGTVDVQAGGLSYATAAFGAQNTGLAGNNGAGSRFSRVNLGGPATFLNLTNTDVTIGSLTGNGTVINVAPQGTAGTVGLTVARTFNVGFDSASDFTFAGSFARWNDALPAAFQVNKVGTTNMILTGTSTTTNNLVVSQGTVTFSGGGNGVFGTYIPSSGGTLTLDNSGAAGNNLNNRLGGTTAIGTIQMSGGTFRLVGNSGVATTETIANLNFGTSNSHGPSMLQVESSGQTTQLNVTTLGGIGQGGGVISGVNSTVGALGTSNVVVSTTFNGLGGGGANSTTTMTIRPDILVDNTVGGAGKTFAVRDSVTGALRPMVTTTGGPTAIEVLTNVLPGSTNTNVNTMPAASITNGSNMAVGSVILANGINISQTPNLMPAVNPDALPVQHTINTGGVLAQTGTSSINVGRITTTSNAQVILQTQGNLSVTGVIAGTTGGLSKIGAGNLTLGSRELYTGNTNFTGGTTILAGGDYTIPVLATAGVPTTSNLSVNAGATLDLNGTNETIQVLFTGSNSRYPGQAGTVTNTSTTPVLLTNQGNSAQTWGGVISDNATGTVSFTKSGNNALTLTNASTYRGVTTVRSNTLNLIEQGTILNSSAINVNYAGLNIDQSGMTSMANINLQRINAAAPVSMRGGTLTLTSAGTSDSTQTVNTISTALGHNTISVPQPQMGSTAVLSLGTLTVDPDSTINFTGGNGGFFGNAPGLNNSNLKINTLVNNGYVAFNNTPQSLSSGSSIAGKILGGNILANNGEFATYVSSTTTGSNGFEWGVVTMNGSTGPLTTITQDLYDGSVITATGSATFNVRTTATGAVTFVAGGTTYNSLAFRQGAATTITFSANTDVMNLNSGGLAMTNGQAVTLGASAGNGVLTAGGTQSTGTARLYVHSNAGSTINSVIANNPNGATVRLVANVIGSTLTLGGSNTYTGGTVVNGGSTLAIAAAGYIKPNGGVTINNSTMTQTAAANSATVGIDPTTDVTINGGGVLTFGAFANTLSSVNFNNIGGTATPTVTIGTVSLTLSSANPITSVNDNLAFTPTVAGTALILSNANPTITTSTTAAVPTNLIISAPITSAGGAVIKSGTGSLALSGANTFTTGVRLDNGTLILANNAALGTGTLTVNATAGGATAGIISDGTLRTITNAVALNSDVTFGSTSGVANAGAVAGNGVTMSGGVNLGAVTRTINVNSYLNTTTMSGVVSNGAAGVGLTKAGPGILVLSNTANTFDGPVTINGGILSATLAGSLGSGVATNSITFGGGILQHGGTNTTDYSSRFTTASNQPFYIDTVANNVTYASPMTSATGGSLAKFGTGNLTLTATETYDGTTTISGGTLQIGATGTTSAGGPTGLLPTATNIFNAATLLYSKTTTDTLSGVISGYGNLTKQGTGQLILSGVNTYTGTTTISAITATPSAGSVLAQANNALGTGPATVMFNTGATSAQLQLSGGITLNNTTITTTGVGSDLATGGTSGTIRNISGNNTITSQLNLTGGGGDSTYRADAGTLTFTGTVGSTATAGRNMNLVGAGNFVFTGLIRDSNQVPANGSDKMNVVSSNTGLTIISGVANTYTGATTVNAGSTLNVAVLANINTPSSIGAGSLAGSAADLVIGGTLQYTGVTPQSTNRPYTINTTGGAIDASGATGAPVTLANTAAITLAGTNTARTLTITGGNTDVNTLAGIIGNNGTGATSLLKSGTGTWAITATSTYTGATTVAAGKLLNNGVLSATSSVTVQNTGTFGGTGSIAGPLAVQTGGTLAPGNSPGVVTMTGTGAAGAITMSSGSTYAVEVGGLATPDGTPGTYDQTKTASDTVTIDGAKLSVTSFNNFASSDNTSDPTKAVYLLALGGTNFVQPGGTGNLFVDPVSGAPYPEGATVVFPDGSGSGTITYLANWTGSQSTSSLTGGNDVALYNVNMVPEPGTAGLLSLAGLGLLARRRRRKA